MHRLIQLEEHVVGRIDHVVDGTLSDAGQPHLQPVGRGPDAYPSNHGCHVARASIGVLNNYLDTLLCDRARGILDKPSPWNRGQFHRMAQDRTKIPSYAFVTQQVGTVGRHLDIEAIVGHRQNVEEWRPRRRVGIQQKNP